MAAVPEASHRLYNCRRCGEQVQVCRGCDRGNIYCAGGCAALRRRESLRRAGRRYQLSFRGACRHAARQRTWRMRRAHKVTHHGSPRSALAATVLAPSLQSTRRVQDGQGSPVGARGLPRCSFCARALSAFARLGPLRGGP